METLSFLIFRIGVYFFSGLLWQAVLAYVFFEKESLFIFKNIFFSGSFSIYAFTILIGLIFSEITQIFFNFLFGVYFYIFDTKEFKIENIFPFLIKNEEYVSLKALKNSNVFLLTYIEFLICLSIFFGDLSFISLFFIYKSKITIILSLTFLFFLLSLFFRIQANRYLKYLELSKK